MRFMELGFSADTIDKLFDTLRLIPKEQLEERSIALRNEVEEKEISETEALNILMKLKSELTTSNALSQTAT